MLHADLSVEQERNVPLMLRLRLLFGDWLSQVGWAIFGLTMLVVEPMLFHTDFTSWYLFNGPLEHVAGKVTLVEWAGVSADDERDIYEFRYTFRYDNDTYEGRSYKQSGPKPGQDTTVEFPSGRPNLSRIAGMNRDAASIAELLLCLVFPVTGVLLASSRLPRAFRCCNLLATGMVANATLAGGEVREANFFILLRAWRLPPKLSFIFLDQNGMQRKICIRSSFCEKPLDHRNRAVLYDPSNPDRAVLFEEFDAKPRMDDHGRITWPKSERRPVFLLIPGAAILGSVAYLLLQLISG